MITPRTTRLLRVPDLRTFQRSLLDLIPPGLSARSTAVIVPRRSAARQLRRTIEGRLLERGTEAAVVLPDLLTRSELYDRLHARVAEAPARLTAFDRDVLLRLAAGDAAAAGAAPPFRLRPGILAAMIQFYDELRRRGRTIDSLDRHIRAGLEEAADSDRGAARLLELTAFLSAAFAAFERRVHDSGRVDEHGLRALLLSDLPASPYRQVVVAVADRPAEAGGLWPADLDLLARVRGLERLDVVATDAILASGWHQRLQDALPEIEEVAIENTGADPTLLIPEPAAGAEASSHFVCRDREEEVATIVRQVKRRAREGGASAAPLDRTAVVFQRPLPYLYLARSLFPAADVAYHASDDLPLAAEPFAAALDLVFAVALEDATRTTLIELLASPHWRIFDPADPAGELTRGSISAFDRLLQEAKYLGGWARLEDLAASAATASARPRSRQEALREGAVGPLRAAASLAPVYRRLLDATTASAQIRWIFEFLRSYGRSVPAGEPDEPRDVRARTAVLGALGALAETHVRFDDRPILLPELVSTIRRWTEAQTFSLDSNDRGVLLLDPEAARFADVDILYLPGLVESDWPPPAEGSIFYPQPLLREIGWHPESERLAACRAAFRDLLRLPTVQVAVSSFTLEEDALVAPSAFLADLGSAGLSAVSSAAAAPVRVFTHEALYLEPLMPGAVAGAASRWLELRTSRSDGADARYRGRIRACAPEAYSVSRVERYLECPFKYFAGHLLHLEEERDDESGLSPQERGQVLHGVFEAFFARWHDAGQRAITLENLSQAAALFGEVAEAALGDLSEADRALERTYLLGSAASPGLAERAFAFEIEHGIPVLQRLLEYPLEGQFRFEGEHGTREVRVRGKADRIDLLADGSLCVVDYKLGRAPKASRALQLPVYAVSAVQQLRGRLGQEWVVGRAGYLAFRERNAFVEFGGRSPLDEALKEGQHRFIRAIARIEAGEFPPDPDELWTCNRCGFPHVCRKDYVGDE